MTGSIRRIIVVLALCSGFASAVEGQRIRGVVVLGDSTTPAPGAIIEVRDSSGVAVSRGLSAENGAFELNLPSAGSFQLRVLRVGFRPSIEADVAIASGETVTRRLVMTGLPLGITGVNVRTSRQCRINADTGQLISQLWVAARTALQSTQLASPDGAATAHWSVTDLETDVRGTLVLSERTVEQASLSSRPFKSLPPDSLARVGFVSYVKGVDTFTAPDAEVMLSDVFARTHCFQLVQKHPKHPEWLGIAFSPVDSKFGFSDIDGTLWLDRTNGELHRLDYRYTNLPKQVNAADPGGWVEFAHLPNGLWFVSRWSIRMPHATKYDNNEWTPGAFDRDRVAGERLVIESVQIRTGQVRSIVQNGGALLFTTGDDASVATNADSTAQELALCRDFRGGTQYSVLYGHVLDSSRQPVPNAVATIAWQDNSHCLMSGECTFDAHKYTATADATGAWWFCGALQGVPISLSVQLGANFFRRITVQIDDGKRVMKLDVPVSWP